MSGRSRLPGGEPRKASQRNARRAVSHHAKAPPVWRASMPVLWKGRAGIFRRDVGDGEHAEVVIEGRVYRAYWRARSTSLSYQATPRAESWVRRWAALERFGFCAFASVSARPSKKNVTGTPSALLNR